MNAHLDELAQQIWDYHLLHHRLQPVDCILALGSNDTRVAERAAELFLDNLAPILVFSGGFGVLTRHLYDVPEADYFADIAVRMGVPRDRMLIENQSTNTGENILFTQRLLARHHLDPHQFILVQKPYMERRAFATFKKHWPEKELIVTSPRLTYAEYPNQTISRDTLINIMVGDLQRIREYPDRGFQIPQDIPEAVWAAYEELVAMGYDKHLI